MKCFLLYPAVATVVASMASATPTCVSLIGQPAQECQLDSGSLTLSGFNAFEAGVSIPNVMIGAGTTSNSLFVGFQPAFGSPQIPETLFFQLNVTSTNPIQAVTLNFPGGQPLTTNNAVQPQSQSQAPSILQWVCTDGCLDPVHNLQTVQATGPQDVYLGVANQASTLTILSYLQVPAGMAIPGFGETFNTWSDPATFDAPEPLSLLLIGSGLLALGMVGRRKRPLG